MTLEQRKAEFISEVHESAKDKYSLTMKEDFIEYWTEIDRKKKTTMRFEGEKYFSMGRRLGRWAKNEKQWNTPKILNTQVKEAKLIEVDFKKYG